jgi:hypothetical protein
MRRQKRANRGIALIIVLGMVFLYALFASMMVIAGRISTISERVHTRRTEAKYAAESATAMAMWLTATYNFRNPLKGTDEEEPGTTRWVPGAGISNMTLPGGLIANVKIYDLNRGRNIHRLASDRARIVATIAEEDEERRAQMDDMFATYLDYIDRDDVHSAVGEGLEFEDYEGLGLEGFPRNGPMQFREEMYWIRGSQHLINPSGRYNFDETIPGNNFRVIPPKDTRNRVPGGVDPQPQRTDFWSAPMNYILATMPVLSEDELDIIRTCHGRGRQISDDMRDCLGQELHAQLSQFFSFDETPTVVFTIITTAAYPDGSVARRVVATLNLRNVPAAPTSRVSAVARNTIQYWQWQAF